MNVKLIKYTLLILISISSVSSSCSTIKDKEATLSKDEKDLSTNDKTNGIDENFHLYLLVGQSNMAGRGSIDEISKQTNAHILSLNKEGKWGVAQDPIHFDRPGYVGVGPGLSFANTLLGLENNKKIKIGLIPCAVGGSGIESWREGVRFSKDFPDYPYDDAIKRAEIALKSGVLKGILWHQGESDTNEMRKAKYMDRLKKLVADFRKDLNASGVPFVVGELGYYKENFKDFNSVLQNVAKEIENSALVTAEGLTPISDGVHLDTKSARELGKRYAEAMYQLRKK